jgi:hypothetical protein
MSTALLDVATASVPRLPMRSRVVRRPVSGQIHVSQTPTGRARVVAEMRITRSDSGE